MLYQRFPTKRHVTCLQPHTYIRAVVGVPRLHFDVTPPPQLALVQHMRGFIQTIPVDSGSNDLVLDSLRYVGDTDFYTDHLCFAASLLRHLPSRALAPPWTFNHGMGYIGGCLVHR